MLLEILILGALMGMLGQGARAVAGLKSMSDDAKALGVSSNDLFEASRLITSFLIGSLVGLASALVYIIDGGSTSTEPTWHFLLAWAGAAYAGTDFLESFISQYLTPGASAAAIQKLPIAALLKARAQLPAFTHDEAEKIVMDVLQAGPQVNDKTNLSDLGYANEPNLYILAGQINAVIVQKGYVIDNSGIPNWSTVGDVVTSVQNATKKPAKLGGQP
jgi:hypothetical protein